MKPTILRISILDHVRRAAQEGEFDSSKAGRLADYRRQLRQRLERVRARGGAFSGISAGPALESDAELHARTGTANGV